jgi:peptidoglycan/LPS O-acetylase OafA/YrhL
VAVWVVCTGLVAVAVTVPGGLRRVLSRPWPDRLGRITYGLYLLHEIVIWSRRRVAFRVGWFPGSDLVWPVVTLTLTVGLAWLSYAFLERPFLRLKERWARVRSRPV